MLTIIKAADNKTFHENKKPIACLKLSFAITKGIPAPTVPAGQINLQKKGEAIPSFK